MSDDTFEISTNQFVQQSQMLPINEYPHPFMNNVFLTALTIGTIMFNSVLFLGLFRDIMLLIDAYMDQQHGQLRHQQ
jgi:hypothetical protein